MGETSPQTARPAASGTALVRNAIMAVIYVALIPLVAALGLVGAATYFPESTAKLLGPALSVLVTELDRGDDLAQEALGKVASAEERLAELEADIAALVTTVEDIRTGAPDGTVGQATSPGASAEDIAGQVREALAETQKGNLTRDRMLAGLSALTLSRAELMAGNRANAQREVALARDALGVEEGSSGDSTGLSDDLASALAKADDALAKGSPAAADWLSLAWHELAEALAGAE